MEGLALDRGNTVYYLGLNASTLVFKSLFDTPFVQSWLTQNSRAPDEKMAWESVSLPAVSVQNSQFSIGVSD